MKLSELTRKIHIVRTNITDFEIDISEIYEKSEEVQDGGLFAAVAGTKKDGYDYIEDALEHGARVIVSEKEPKTACSYIVVENVRQALALLCANRWGNPMDGLNMIAVTGTNGKTTVTYMLKHLFDLAGYKTGVIGTVKYLIKDTEYPAPLTTPDPEYFYRLLSEMKREQVEYVFMEASSHSLALDKLAACSFEAGIFTNLTLDHLDFHQTEENYLLAKCKLFTQSTISLLNADDPKTLRAAEYSKGSVYTYGIHEKADFRAENIVLHGMESSEFDLIYGTQRFHAALSVPSIFNVYNALCAIAAASLCGIDISFATEKAVDFKGVRGRMERLSFAELPVPFTVMIDFAHTPDALFNLLKTIRHAKKDGRLILVFGCGGNRDRSKRPLMGAAASAYADYSVITADNSRNEKTEDIIRDIMAGIDITKPYTVIESRREAIEHALSAAKKGDIVVLAGKGHEDYEIIGGRKRPFSEREIVYNYIQKHYSAPENQSKDADIGKTSDEAK